MSTKDPLQGLAIAREITAAHMAKYDPSHDMAHVERVSSTATKLAGIVQQTTEVDLTVVAFAALLHDMNDAKYADDSTEPLEVVAARAFEYITPAQRDLVLKIIPSVSYSKEQKLRAAGQWTWQDGCVELHIVQDADRLDAIGAIGVLRTAAFSGVKGRLLVEEGDGESCEAHFGDKLLKVREYMKTAAGRDEAERRHQTMVDFLKALEEEKRWA